MVSYVSTPDEMQNYTVLQVLENMRLNTGPTTRITVIGSRARGTHKQDSDLDLLIETEDETELENWRDHGKAKIDQLEQAHALVIDATLAIESTSSTQYLVRSIKTGEYEKLQTDNDCGHAGQDRCADCHACGEHRQVEPWRFKNRQYILLCRTCHEETEQNSERWRRGMSCPYDRPQALRQLGPHHQSCQDCIELQPGMRDVLQQTADSRGRSTPRAIVGRASSYWLNYNS